MGGYVHILPSWASACRKEVIKEMGLFTVICDGILYCYPVSLLYIL